MDETKESRAEAPASKPASATDSGAGFDSYPYGRSASFYLHNIVTYLVIFLTTYFLCIVVAFELPLLRLEQFAVSKSPVFSVSPVLTMLFSNQKWLNQIDALAPLMRLIVFSVNWILFITIIRILIIRGASPIFEAIASVLCVLSPGFILQMSIFNSAIASILFTLLAVRQLERGRLPHWFDREVQFDRNGKLLDSFNETPAPARLIGSDDRWELYGGISAFVAALFNPYFCFVFPVLYVLPVGDKSARDRLASKQYRHFFWLLPMLTGLAFILIDVYLYGNPFGQNQTPNQFSGLLPWIYHIAPLLPLFGLVIIFKLLIPQAETGKRLINERCVIPLALTVFGFVYFILMSQLEPDMGRAGLIFSMIFGFVLYAEYRRVDKQASWPLIAGPVTILAALALNGYIYLEATKTYKNAVETTIKTAEKIARGRDVVFYVSKTDFILHRVFRSVAGEARMTDVNPEHASTDDASRSTEAFVIKRESRLFSGGDILEYFIFDNSPDWHKNFNTTLRYNSVPLSEISVYSRLPVDATTLIRPPKPQDVDLPVSPRPEPTQ